MIDEITELVQVQVNCDTKTVSSTKRVFGLSSLSDGWQETIQRHHTQRACNKQGVASQLQWSLRDVIVDENYNYAATFIATPSDCP